MRGAPVLATGDTSWYYPAVFVPTMPSGYIAIFVFALLSAAIPMLAFKFVCAGMAKRPLSREVNSQEPAPEATEIDRVTRFYVIAVLFVICDAAFVFLLPWAVKFESLGVYGVVAMFAFIGVLAVGYLWIRNKGVLDSV